MHSVKVDVLVAPERAMPLSQRYPLFQERKSSPKSKFWCRISRGCPRGYPGGRPGAKASVRPSKSWKNKHFGADIHDPKARTSMTPGGLKKLQSEKLRAEFSFPTIVRYGVFGASTWAIGCVTPSPFSEHFPLGEHAKWRCDTPPQRGISAVLARSL